VFFFVQLLIFAHLLYFDHLPSLILLVFLVHLLRFRLRFINWLKPIEKIECVIDSINGVVNYNGKEEKLNYNNGIILNQLFLTEENTILPSKEYYIKNPNLK